MIPCSLVKMTYIYKELTAVFSREENKFVP
jgi:hypothetical protein